MKWKCLNYKTNLLRVKMKLKNYKSKLKKMNCFNNNYKKIFKIGKKGAKRVIQSVKNRRENYKIITSN